jgi:hypothetical protein
MRFLAKPRLSVGLLTVVWVQVLSVAVAGSGLMVATLATHGGVVFIVVLLSIAVASLGALSLLFIVDKHNLTWATLLAVLPAILAATALIVYCSVLVTVHNRAVNAQIASADTALNHLRAAANAANRAHDVASRAAATAVGDLSRQLARLQRRGPEAIRRFVDRVEHA